MRGVWMSCDRFFLHDPLWISLWIKPISKYLDIINVFTWSRHNCLVVSGRLWCHQQNENWDAGMMCKDLHFYHYLFIPFYHVTNKIMYVLSWQIVSVLTWVLFWCLFPWLLRNSGYKHQNNPLVSTKTVRHSSTYIILCHNHVFPFCLNSAMTSSYFPNVAIIKGDT